MTGRDWDKWNFSTTINLLERIAKISEAKSLKLTSLHCKQAPTARLQTEHFNLDRRSIAKSTSSTGSITVIFAKWTLNCNVWTLNQTTFKLNWSWEIDTSAKWSAQMTWTQRLSDVCLNAPEVKGQRAHRTGLDGENWQRRQSQLSWGINSTPIFCLGFFLFLIG